MTLIFMGWGAQQAVAQVDPMQQIKADEQIRTGKLPNGLTYYIRHNEKSSISYTMLEPYRRTTRSRVWPTSSSTWPSTVRRTSRRRV